MPGSLRVKPDGARDDDERHDESGNVPDGVRDVARDKEGKNGLKDKKADVDVEQQVDYRKRVFQVHELLGEYHHENPDGAKADPDERALGDERQRKEIQESMHGKMVYKERCEVQGVDEEGPIFHEQI